MRLFGRVGIAVADLDSATAFCFPLGLEVGGVMTTVDTVSLQQPLYGQPDRP